MLKLAEHSHFWAGFGPLKMFFQALKFELLDQTRRKPTPWTSFLVKEMAKTHDTLYLTLPIFGNRVVLNVLFLFCHCVAASVPYIQVVMFLTSPTNVTICVIRTCTCFEVFHRISCKHVDLTRLGGVAFSVYIMSLDLWCKIIAMECLFPNILKISLTHYRYQVNSAWAFFFQTTTTYILLSVSESVKLMD